ncbi:DUF4349 domain-containing protein [Nocardia flavorosea]|uniref:DUF4349 domain-containing protein n=1 Tax=Nocardia flavorosea TaxID=53429 RepID=UPI0018945CBD|nr:DUF4349 domain-containing protein [Nocardia flavorosea]MBF6349316.1 DUF4349 domain-containing protein [Nocardia flavorosea]
MRRLGVLFVVLCGAVLLAGCGSDSGSTSHAPASAEGGAPAATPGFRIQQSPAREQAPAPDNGPQVTDRKEVVTGTVDLTADDPIAAAQALADRVARLDGRIDQRTENPGTEDDDPHANLVIRIPAGDTDAFIDGLGEVGEVTEISTNRDDVTLQWQDLDARITALRASVDRLRDLMARAANTADLIAAEEALADRQAELDSLTGQRRYLDDQIGLSTLTIDISATAAKKGDTGPANFWDGVVDGWNSLIDWLRDAVVFAGQALPWLGFLAVLGAIVAAIVRVFQKGRDKIRGTATVAPGAGSAAPHATAVPADGPGTAGESAAAAASPSPTADISGTAGERAASSPGTGAPAKESARSADDAGGSAEKSSGSAGE